MNSMNMKNRSIYGDGTYISYLSISLSNTYVKYTRDESYKIYYRGYRGYSLHSD